jgi:hypothetical protein
MIEKLITELSQEKNIMVPFHHVRSRAPKPKPIGGIENITKEMKEQYELELILWNGHNLADTFQKLDKTIVDRRD